MAAVARRRKQGKRRLQDAPRAAPLRPQRARVAIGYGRAGGGGNGSAGDRDEDEAPGQAATAAVPPRPPAPASGAQSTWRSLGDSSATTVAPAGRTGGEAGPEAPTAILAAAVPAEDDEERDITAEEVTSTGGPPVEGDIRAGGPEMRNDRTPNGRLPPDPKATLAGDPLAGSAVLNDHGLPKIVPGVREQRPRTVHVLVRAMQKLRALLRLCGQRQGRAKRVAREPNGPSAQPVPATIERRGPRRKPKPR